MIRILTLNQLMHHVYTTVLSKFQAFSSEFALLNFNKNVKNVWNLQY